MLLMQAANFVRFVPRSDAAGACFVPGVRGQVVREALRGLLLRRVLLLLQEEHQEEDCLQLHL